MARRHGSQTRRLPAAQVAQRIADQPDPTIPKIAPYPLTYSQTKAFVKAAHGVTGRDTLDTLVSAHADNIAEAASEKEIIRYRDAESMADSDDWNEWGDSSYGVAALELEAGEAGRKMKAGVRPSAEQSLRLLVQRMGYKHNRPSRHA